MRKQVAYHQNSIPASPGLNEDDKVVDYSITSTPAADTGKRQLFPLKLWDLVNLPEPFNPGVKWSDDGTKIIVDRQSLQNSYLKKDDTIFRTRSVDSFVRQLHFYGFRKTVGPKESDTVIYYRHECFQREKPELLLKMKRTYKRRPCSLQTTPDNTTAPATTPIQTPTTTTSSATAITTIANITTAATNQPANLTNKTIASSNSINTSQQGPLKTIAHLDKGTIETDEEKPVMIYTITDSSKISDPNADAYAKALWPDQLVLLNSWRGEYHFVEAHFIYNPKRYTSPSLSL